MTNEISNNLLAINISTSPVASTITQLPTVNGVPSNLLSVNTSQLSQSAQFIAGKLQTVNLEDLGQTSILNNIIPNSIFTSGSIEEISEKALSLADKYINSLPKPFSIPTIPTLSIQWPPERPSYGHIKSFIKNRTDRIKQERQEASLASLEEKLKIKSNPFTYRETVINDANAKALARLNIR